MKYTYYPGCSLEVSSRSYNDSALAVSELLGVELIELEDWNCCGATVYLSYEELISFSLCARNLALAEKYDRDLVVPCSSCYTSLMKTASYIQENAELRDKINQALQAAGLEYKGKVNIKHLLEVYVNDIGLDAIKSKVKRELKGLKVAPYYGCQIVRPLHGFDDPENPTSLDRLIEALGATPVYFPNKTSCCGSSLIATNEELAFRMQKDLLLCVSGNEAEVIITVCPLCHMALDAYQKKVGKMYDFNFKIPVLHFTQLMGLALEIPSRKLGIKTGLVPLNKALTAYI